MLALLAREAAERRKVRGSHMTKMESRRVGQIDKALFKRMYELRTLICNFEN